ncbi:MAG: V0D/AC39 family V-type ATPase subunit [Thiobacillaceae bacterium]
MSAFLNARVSIFSERLWSPEQYSALMRTPDAEMAQTLERLGLPKLAAGYNSRDGLSLESRIITQLLEETLIIVRPLQGAARQFILYWTERFEVSNVKTLLRAKMADERPAAVASRLVNMGPFARLDLDSLVHAEDETELFRRLESSPYADIVRHALRAFEESRDPFILDATLDRAYYEGLVRRAKALDGQVGRDLRVLMADLIDRINLVWLLRYRFNYELPAAQVYYLLVGTGYHLSGQLLQKLVTQPSMEAVMARLPGPMARTLEGARSIVEVFRRLERVSKHNATRILAIGANALERAFAYLILREQNLRAVRAIMRGRHLRLPLDNIQQAIGQDLVGSS